MNEMRPRGEALRAGETEQSQGLGPIGVVLLGFLMVVAALGAGIWIIWDRAEKSREEVVKMTPAPISAKAKTPELEPGPEKVVLKRGVYDDWHGAVIVPSRYTLQVKTGVPLMVTISTEGEDSRRFLQLDDGRLFRIEGGNPEFGAVEDWVKIPGGERVRVRYRGLFSSHGKGFRAIPVPDFGLDQRLEHEVVFVAREEAAVWVNFPPQRELPPRSK